METARIARPLDGDDLYQQRARVALPLLVRLAHARVKTYYSDLAAELGMPNPRNLNYPLGSIGTAIEELSREWGEKIPAIQCLVVNKDTDLPGEGIGWFVRDKGEFRSLPRRKQQAIVDGVQAEVFAYPRWNEVLAAFGLEPVQKSYEREIADAARYQGGGESELHKALKAFVAANPGIVGVSSRAGMGRQEHPLPSGDTVDVFFSYRAIRTAVEVKSRISPPADIVRGLYQCVKYRAVLNACVVAENSEDTVEVALVLESSLPKDLADLRSRLDVTVVENVRAT